MTDNLRDSSFISSINNIDLISYDIENSLYKIEKSEENLLTNDLKRAKQLKIKKKEISDSIKKYNNNLVKEKNVKSNDYKLKNKIILNTIKSNYNKACQKNYNLENNIDDDDLTTKKEKINKNLDKKSTILNFVKKNRLYALLKLSKTNKKAKYINNDKNNLTIDKNDESNTLMNSLNLNIQYKINNTCKRHYYNFKNIEDSLSEEEEDENYCNYIPRWYSIHPKSLFSKTLSYLTSYTIVSSLIFFPLELTYNKFEFSSLFIHVLFEIILFIIFILNLLTGFKENNIANKNSTINYSIIEKLKFYNKKFNILIQLIVLFLLIYNCILVHVLIKAIKFSLNKSNIAIEINIISKFLLLILLTSWINPNEIIKQYNNSFNNSSKSNKLFLFSPTFISTLKVITFYFILIHIFSCSWIYLYVYSIRNGSNKNWVISQNVEISNTVKLYVTSFYFSLTTLLSVGYGDINPINTYETMFCIVFMVIGCFFYSFLITLTSFIYNKKETKLSIFLKKKGILDDIHTTYNLNYDLYKKLYQAIGLENKEINKEKISLIEDLPRNLTMTMQRYLYRDIVSRLHFFEEASNKNLIYEICHNLKHSKYFSNIVLLNAGGLLEEIFFVYKGSLILSLGDKYGNYPISKVTRGFSFGEHYIYDISCNFTNNDCEKICYSDFSVKTASYENEILTISKDKFKQLAYNYEKDIVKFLEKSYFRHDFIEKIKKGAITFFEIQGNLTHYKTFINNLLNNQINNELNNEALNINKNTMLPINLLLKKKIY